MTFGLYYTFANPKGVILSGTPVLEGDRQRQRNEDEHSAVTRYSRPVSLIRFTRAGARAWRQQPRKACASDATTVKKPRKNVASTEMSRGGGQYGDNVSILTVLCYIFLVTSRAAALVHMLRSQFSAAVNSLCNRYCENSIFWLDSTYRLVTIIVYCDYFAPVLRQSQYLISTVTTSTTDNEST